MIRDLKAGRMVMLIVAILAEFFLRLTIQRVHEMKEVRYQNGLPNGAARFGSCNGLCSKCTAPSGPGYCPLVGHADRGDGRVLVPHPIESHILRLIYGKKNDRPQCRLDVYWLLRNFVRTHFTTKQIPAVALGIVTEGLSNTDLFRLHCVHP